MAFLTAQEKARLGLLAKQGDLPAQGWADHEAALDAIVDISLSAAAEAGNAIVVSGQLKDANGENIAAAKEVFVEVIAPTAAKGQITVTAGTGVVTVNDGAGKIHRSWLTTTSAGVFSISIADDVAEAVLVKVTSEGVTSLLKITFA